MSILEKIVKNKKAELKRLKLEKPLSILRDNLRPDKNSAGFFAALQKNSNFHFICEIKKASPSKGIIQPNFDPVRQAEAYYKGGASAISILTDQKFFKGKLNYLKLVKKTVPLPLLRKDFIIDPYQIYETKAAGGDLILLIARILSRPQIRDFSDIASDLKLDVLLELADPGDLKKIDNFDNKIIGINNRNLSTFKTDINNSIVMKKLLPRDIPVISESGIKSVQDCLLLRQHGFRGVLIGESLMKSLDPAKTLQEWIKGISDVYKA